MDNTPDELVDWVLRELRDTPQHYGAMISLEYGLRALAENQRTDDDQHTADKLADVEADLAALDHRHQILEGKYERLRKRVLKKNVDGQRKGL